MGFIHRVRGELRWGIRNIIPIIFTSAPLDDRPYLDLLLGHPYLENLHDVDFSSIHGDDQTAWVTHSDGDDCVVNASNGDEDQVAQKILVRSPDHMKEPLFQNEIRQDQFEWKAPSSEWEQQEPSHGYNHLPILGKKPKRQELSHSR